LQLKNQFEFTPFCEQISVYLRSSLWPAVATFLPDWDHYVCHLSHSNEYKIGKYFKHMEIIEILSPQQKIKTLLIS